MSSAQLPRCGYHSKVAIIFVLTLVDLALNGTADHNDFSSFRAYPAVIFGAQMLIQLLNLLMLFMLFFGTYLFQVGLISLLMKEFRATLYTLPAYGVLFVIYGGVKLALFLGPSKLSQEDLWSEPGFVFLSIIQKIGSLVYYIALLNICIRLGERQWYERGPWVARLTAAQQQQQAARQQGAGLGSNNNNSNGNDGSDGGSGSGASSSWAAGAGGANQRRTSAISNLWSWSNGKGADAAAGGSSSQSAAATSDATIRRYSLAHSLHASSNSILPGGGSSNGTTPIATVAQPQTAAVPVPYASPTL